MAKRVQDGHRIITTNAFICQLIQIEKSLIYNKCILCYNHIYHFFKEGKKMKQKTKKSFLAAAMIGLVRLIYPKTKIEGLENLPDEPVIIVGNHCQIHGPICCELFLPKNSFTWCASEMMQLKQVMKYLYQD